MTRIQVFNPPKKTNPKQHTNRKLKSIYYGDNFRLAFPYRNQQGQITGLLKRATAPKGIEIKTYDGKEYESVRWDSTPGTTKEDLFRLNECKGFETVLIVEGYTDALYWSKCIRIILWPLARAGFQSLNLKD